MKSINCHICDAFPRKVRDDISPIKNGINNLLNTSDFCGEIDLYPTRIKSRNEICYIIPTGRINLKASCCKFLYPYPEDTFIKEFPENSFSKGDFIIHQRDKQNYILHARDAKDRYFKKKIENHEHVSKFFVHRTSYPGQIVNILDPYPKNIAINLAKSYDSSIDEHRQFDYNQLSEIQQSIIACLYTCHQDGFVREHYLKKLFSYNFYWTIPFIMQLVSSYIIEILDTIYANMTRIDSQFYVEYIKNNYVFYQKVIKQRVISYWNAYYRYFSHDPIPVYDYVGFKILRTLDKWAALSHKSPCFMGFSLGTDG